MNSAMPSSSQAKLVFKTIFRSSNEIVDFEKDFCVDKNEKTNDDFVDQLLADIAKKNSERWGFDFTLDQPIPSSSNSRFEYTVLKNEEIPYFYRSIEPHYQFFSDEGSDSENNNPVFKKSVVFSKCQKSKRPKGLETPRKQQTITAYISRRKHNKLAAPISKPLKQLNQPAHRRFSLQP